jgi:hypothetical protein
VVGRPADDALAVPGEIYREHGGPVTRQRVHLPPTHLLFRITAKAKPAGKARSISPPPRHPQRTPTNKAHLASSLRVPDLHAAVLRPADDATAVRRESDGPHPAHVPCQRAHLPPTHLYLMGGPGKWLGFLSGLWYQEGLIKLRLVWQKFC